MHPTVIWQHFHPSCCSRRLRKQFFLFLFAHDTKTILFPLRDSIKTPDDVIEQIRIIICFLVASFRAWKHKKKQKFSRQKFSIRVDKWNKKVKPKKLFAVPAAKSEDEEHCDTFIANFEFWQSSCDHGLTLSLTARDLSVNNKNY